MCKKAFSSLHSLTLAPRLKHFLPTHIKSILVKLLVFPHLEYCDVFLTNLKDELARRLQRVQNACLRFIFLLKYSDHLTPSYRQLSILKLNERRSLHRLTLRLQQPSCTNVFRRLAPTIIVTPGQGKAKYSRSLITLIFPIPNRSQFPPSKLGMNDLLPETQQLQSISKFKKSVTDLLQF